MWVDLITINKRVSRSVRILRFYWTTLHKYSTIDQVTTMLATSKNIPFPGHNHLLTTGTDDQTLLDIAQAPTVPH